MTGRRASIWFILFTVVIDMLGIGLVIPILPKLVQSMLGGAVAEASFVYGVLTSLYALAMFFCSPILGALSDRFGRRPVVLLALLGLGCDYVLLSFAPNIWWLVAGRLIAGAFGATQSTAAAYIADISPPEKRAENFGYIGVAFGIGFVAGPALGGLLGEGNLRLPFMVAAGLSFLNLLFGIFVLPESLKPENRRTIVLGQTNPVGALRAVWRYASVAALIPVLASAFLAQRGLETVWVPYTTYRYNWSVAEVGLSLAIVGALSIVFQSVLIRPTVARLGEARALVVALVIVVITYVLYGIAWQGWMIYAVSVPFMAGMGMIGPAAQGLMSRSVPANEQGLLQGAMSSVTTASAIFGPLLANGLFAFFIGSSAPMQLPGAPFFSGALLILLALGLTVRNVVGAQSARYPAEGVRELHHA